VELAPSSMRIRGSESALREVFEILFHNSVRHSGRGPGELHVSLSADMVVVKSQQGNEKPMSCRLVVEDNGNGIPPGDLETVFKPFYTTHDQGNGLGLPIARRLVTRHDGSISAVSPLGVGARFEIVMPLVEQTAVGSA
jgi:signal transduction histidine kinase